MKLTGYAAIEAKEANDTITLCKHNDPIEPAREGLTVDEARQIAKEDPSLIYANDWSEYTAQIPTDPTYWGSDCTADRAEIITARIDQMIRAQFPGIQISQSEAIGGRAGTLGPDDDQCQEIDRWIGENWTAAL